MTWVGNQVQQYDCLVSKKMSDQLDPHWEQTYITPFDSTNESDDPAKDSKRSWDEFIPSHIGFQFTFAFVLGLIFSPFSWGLLFLIIFFVIWELMLFAYYRDYSFDYFTSRAVIIAAYFLGFIVGRLAIGDHYPARWNYYDGCQYIGCRNYHYPLKKHELGRCSDCRRKRGRRGYHYRHRRQWLGRARQEDVDQLFADFA